MKKCTEHYQMGTRHAVGHRGNRKKHLPAEGHLSRGWFPGKVLHEDVIPSWPVPYDTANMEPSSCNKAFCQRNPVGTGEWWDEQKANEAEVILRILGNAESRPKGNLLR